MNTRRLDARIPSTRLPSANSHRKPELEDAGAIACRRLSSPLAAVVLIPLLGAAASAQTTERISVSSAGAQGNGQSLSCDISSDGRIVSFVSLANNLVPSDTNGVLDAFVRNLDTGITERVSVSSTGVQGNAHSGDFRPALSADGRFVAFDSLASNLVPGDTNAAGDTFLRDRVNGTTQRISVSSAGVQGNSHSGSSGLAISADAGFVAFVSSASNLVSGDVNGVRDVFVRDRAGNATELISKSSSGVHGNLTSGDYPLSISADGRFVVYVSWASNLVAGDTNLASDVFLRDRVNGTTQRISVSGAGIEGDGGSGLNGAFISADGRFVAFESLATNLVAGDVNGSGDVFVRDLVNGTIELASRNSDGVQSDGWSFTPTLSSDGRFLSFTSGATNLVPGDLGFSDVFVRDRSSGRTERVSNGLNGAQANNDSGINFLGISADGSRVVFSSAASNLVSGDTNGVLDVYLHDRGLLYPGSYCQAGTTTHGCLARLTGSGTPSASSASGFTLEVSSMEGGKPALLFYGIDNTSFTPALFGNGKSFICVKGPVQRMPGLVAGGSPNSCDGAFSVDWNAYIASHPGAVGQPFAAGQHVFAQCWFRDPPAPSGSNFSDAFEFVVGP